ncbi:MAG TPA: class I SAM-dependent methyltransferase [Actinomycetota bacterium]|nr:class I SAM-dependent methyltransferase [Actinomycetota bacterium]
MVEPLETDPIEPELPGPETLVPALEPATPAPLAVPGPSPGSVVVGPVDDVVVDGAVVGGGSVVGGAVVGGSVVVGAVLVEGLGRGLVVVVGAGLLVEVVVRLVLGTITVRRRRVVVGAAELSDETCWRRTRVVVVVVVCETASAACRGEVAKPTTLPPTAPSSIAMTRLTHRLAATNATGRKRQNPPRFELPALDDKRRHPASPEVPRTRRPPRGGAVHHGRRPKGAAMDQDMPSPLDRWREELEAWAIPEEILQRAPESPWSFPVGMFRAKAEHARATDPTPSSLQALRALGDGGTVLDVGAGAGAASLPLAGAARRIVAVDESQGMAEAFLAAAAEAEVEAEAVVGRWPDVAGKVDPADVVVCNDVLYNVWDLGPFALALTDHARRRVVVQITREHPLVPMGPLWRRFHGLERPAGPTADDAVAALAWVGVQADRQDWTTASAGSFERKQDLVAFLRRRLCLPDDRDPEIAEALEPVAVHEAAGWRLPPLHRPVVTLSWPGTAG